MAASVDFEDNGQLFNIHLDEDGDLAFNANGSAGAGQTRMVIADDSGTVTVGGDPGQNGRLQLTDSSGAVTVDLRGDFGQLALGAGGTDGDLICRSSSGLTTIDLNGELSKLQLFDSEGTFRTKRVDLDGVFGRLQLLDPNEQVTADLRGDAGILTLGGANATDGDLFILDSAGNSTIECDGETGSIECVSLLAGGNLKGNVAPLTDALDDVLAIRGVRYESRQVGAPTGAAAGDAQQIGFVDHEVEAACPELVVTGARGRKSVDHFRLTAVLVEAIKEQQQQIRQQASALAEVQQRVTRLETAVDAPHAA